MAKNMKKTIPFLMIAILAAGGIFFFYTKFANRRMPAASSPEVQEIDEAQLEDITPMADPARNPPDFQVILRRHLFGKPVSEKKPATGEPPPPVKLAATSLDLTLLGTITGAPARRRAIILDKKKKGQEIYGQGDNIQGSLIKEIQRDKIILTVNGKDEVLLPEAPQKTQTRPPSFRPAQPPVEPPVAVDSPETPEAEAIGPEALEPPTEPAEGAESAEPPPEDTAVEPVEKEPGNLPPVRRNPLPPPINKK